MASPRRIQVPDTPYHVASRAVDRQMIFGMIDGDRLVFLALLARTAARYGWRVHSYCLMGNHFHLIVETPRANLADGMRDLKSSYALWFNAARPRQGVLFERRYFSELLDDEGHLLELTRYVVLNPVRAGLCRHPAHWRWSSFRATAGIDPAPACLHLDHLLGFFGSAERAPTRYSEFVEDGLLVRRTVAR